MKYLILIGLFIGIGMGLITSYSQQSFGATAGVPISVPSAGNQGFVLISTTSGQYKTISSTSSPQFWLNSNRTDTYTPDGGILRPYTTFSGWVNAAPTNVVGNSVYMAPGTYIDGAPVTAPNVPLYLQGGESVLVVPSGITFQGSYDIFDIILNSCGAMINQSDTSLNITHQLNNSVVITCGALFKLDGNATLVNDTLAPTTLLSVSNGSQTNVLSTVLFGGVNNYGQLQLVDNFMAYSTSSAMIRATTTSWLPTGQFGGINIGLMGFVATGTGGIADIQNGATSSPNNVIGATGFSLTTGITSGTAATMYCDQGLYSLITGAILPPIGSNFVACQDAKRYIHFSLGIASTSVANGLGVNGPGVFTDWVTAPQFNATNTAATSTFQNTSVRNFAQTGTATSTFANGLQFSGGTILNQGWATAGTLCVKSVNGELRLASADCGSGSGSSSVTDKFSTSTDGTSIFANAAVGTGFGSSTPGFQVAIQATTTTSKRPFGISSTTPGGTDKMLFSVDNGGTISANVDSATSTFINLFNQNFVTVSTTSYNTSMGLGALNSATNTAGLGGAPNGNTAFGANALYLATTSPGNTAVGFGALWGSGVVSGIWSTTGLNTAVGQFALASSTSGNSNTALGYQAARLLTTGTNSTFIGFKAAAGASAITGANNTIIGASADTALTSGTQNVAIGTNAGQLNSTGSNNVTIGYNAGFSSGSGGVRTGNTIVGALSGNNVSATAANNTFLGYQIGTNVTSGYDNILIGETQNTSGGNLTTGGGNIFMGYNAVGTTTTVVRALNIGSMLFGQLPATTSATTIIEPIQGTIGIATSSPWGLLSVSANAGRLDGGTAPIFVISSSTATATSTLLSVWNTGNVGVGTTTPYALLSVNAPPDVKSYFSIGSSSSQVLQISPSATAVFAQGTTTQTPMGQFSITQTTVDSTTTPVFVVGSSTVANTGLTIISTGSLMSVGVGTSTPLGAFSVYGPVYMSQLVNSNAGDYVCFNTITGQIEQNATACSLSSIRWKENIRMIDSGLEKIMALRPVLYDLKPEYGTAKNQPGFIAEEALSATPLLVSYGQDGLPSGYDYPKLTVYLTKAVQELNAKLDAQQKEINDLKKNQDNMCRYEK